MRPAVRLALAWTAIAIVAGAGAPQAAPTFLGETNGTSLYVDGIFSEKVGTVIGCPRMEMGSGGFNSMAGLLDDVRVFNRALSAAEVRTIASLGGAVRNTAGNRLDGELGATFPSGQGVQGGDFVARFTASSSSPPPPVPGVDITVGGCGSSGLELLLPVALLLAARRRRRRA